MLFALPKNKMEKLPRDASIVVQVVCGQGDSGNLQLGHGAFRFSATSHAPAAALSGF